MVYGAYVVNGRILTIGSNKVFNFELYRYHSTSVSSIGSKTLPSVSQILNPYPRKWYDDEISPPLTVLNRSLFGHGLPPDNHVQNLDHAEIPAPYVLTSPHHPIPTSQLSILCKRVYCAAKRTDDNGGCTSFYNIQGAGKRSGDASSAICQSINHYCKVKRTDEDRRIKRTGGGDSNISSYNAIYGAGKRSHDASAASQTINRYCPVKRTDEDHTVKRTGKNDRNADLSFCNTAQSIGRYYPDDANALEHFMERGSTSYRYGASTSFESQPFWNRSVLH